MVVSIRGTALVVLAGLLGAAACDSSDASSAKASSSLCKTASDGTQCLCTTTATDFYTIGGVTWSDVTACNTTTIGGTTALANAPAFCIAHDGSNTLEPNSCGCVPYACSVNDGACSCVFGAGINEPGHPNCTPPAGHGCMTVEGVLSPCRQTTDACTTTETEVTECSADAVRSLIKTQTGQTLETDCASWVRGAGSTSK